jgi:hypothetical protein
MHLFSITGGDCPITNADAVIANDNKNIPSRDGSALIDLNLAGNPPVLAENSDVKERALIRFKSAIDISSLKFRTLFVHTVSIKVNGNAIPVCITLKSVEYQYFSS